MTISCFTSSHYPYLPIWGFIAYSWRQYYDRSESLFLSTAPHYCFFANDMMTWWWWAVQQWQWLPFMMIEPLHSYAIWSTHDHLPQQQLPHHRTTNIRQALIISIQGIEDNWCRGFSFPVHVPWVTSVVVLTSLVAWRMTGQWPPPPPTPYSRSLCWIQTLTMRPSLLMHPNYSDKILVILPQRN
mgnify:CR=1 FL=1